MFWFWLCYWLICSFIIDAAIPRYWVPIPSGRKFTPTAYGYASIMVFATVSHAHVCFPTAE